MKDKALGLTLLLVFLCGLISCVPWRKEKEETKASELKWELSRPRRATPRSATTYTARPYAAPAQPQAAQQPQPQAQAPLSPIFVGKHRYKVLVLPFDDSGLPGEFRGMGREASEELVRMLAESRCCVIVDPKAVGHWDETPEGLWDLWKLWGIQGVVKGKVAEVLTAEEEGGTVARVRVEAELISTETAQRVKEAFGQNPLEISRTQGPRRRLEAAKKALRGALSQVRDGLLVALPMIEWATSVIEVKGDEVFINAGRDSGLKVGEELLVFSPGPLIRHPLSGAVIGRSPGEKKGRIRVEGFFGLDAAKASVVEGSGIAPGDLVKPKP